MHVEPCPDQITNLITLLLEVQDKYNKPLMVEMVGIMVEEKVEIVIMISILQEMVVEVPHI